MTSFRNALLLFGLLGWANAFSQANGIRFIIPQLDPIYKQDGTPSIALGFGYDHNFDDNMSMGLEFTFLGRSLTDKISDPYTNTPFTYGTWQANWADKRSTWTVIYRTAYAFGSNSSFGSSYIGSYIGVRGISRELQIDDAFDSQASSFFTGATGPFANRYLATKIVFPVGLRLGIRSVMEGKYYDLYTGLGYQIGGGGSIFNKPELANGPFEIKGLVWHVGFAWGFGW